MVLRGILRKAKTASKRVMKDAWEKIKEDTYADENTDIWRNQKLKLKIWRRIRVVYQRIKESKMKILSKMLWAYSNNLVINKKQVLHKWRKQIIDINPMVSLAKKVY